MFDELSTFCNINNNIDFATFYKLMSYGCDLEIAKIICQEYVADTFTIS